MPVSEVRNRININNYKNNSYNKLSNSYVFNNAVPTKNVINLNLFHSPIISFKKLLAEELDNCIIGFDEEKNILKDKLINPLKLNCENIPFIFVLNSMEKENLALFLDGVKKEIKSSCTIKEVSSNISADKFLEFIRNEIKISSQKFLSSGKRTILLVNDIEKYINASPFELNNKLFSDKDKAFVEKYGLNKEVTALMKNLADYCSKTPNQDKNGAALVILSISSNPHFIDPELLKRKEKLEAIIIPYASSKTIEKNIYNELNKQIQFLDYLQKLPITELKEIDLPYDLALAIQDINIVEKIKSKKINIEKLPIHIITRYCEANDLNGAYSLLKIKDIMQSAFYKYLESKSNNYSDILLEEFISTSKDITKETYIEQNKIKDFVENKKNNNLVLNIKTMKRFLMLSEKNLISKEKQEIIISDLLKKEIDYLKNNLKTNLEIAEIFNDETIQNNKVLQNYKDNYVKKRVLKLNNGKFKFFYGNKKDEYINLYIGSFGCNNSVLWVDSLKISDIKIIQYFLKQLKNIETFSRIKQIEFTNVDNVIDIDCCDTGRLTLDYKKIYSIDV